MILHHVTDFHGPNIVLNFHVDWFDSILTNLTYVRLVTEGQTDTQTSSAIKAPFTQ